MPFLARNLSVLAYANGFTLWHYKASAETINEVTTPGFFAGAADMMVCGDILMVSGGEAARMLVVAGVGSDVRTVKLAA